MNRPDPQPKPTNIVFFGSGPVASRSLELLSGHTRVEAVITKPSTLAEMASVARDVPLFAVQNKTDLSALLAHEHFSSRLGVVIDFGVIISPDVIHAFPLGIINSHFSLLPEWRGADPLTYTILSGQPKTGVSLMLINEGLDTGDLLAQSTYNISKDCTTPQLTHDLIELSDQTLRTIIPLWVDGSIEAVPQLQATIASSKEPSYSHKLTKEDGRIDWTKPAARLEREVRAFAGWPRSTTTIGRVDLVVTKVQIADRILGPGEVLIDTNRLFVGCGSGSLEILSSIPAGKAEMPTASLLNGYRQRLLEKI